MGEFVGVLIFFGIVAGIVYIIYKYQAAANEYKDARNAYNNAVKRSQNAAAAAPAMHRMADELLAHLRDECLIVVPQSAYSRNIGAERRIEILKNAIPDEFPTLEEYQNKIKIMSRKLVSRFIKDDCFHNRVIYSSCMNLINAMNESDLDSIILSQLESAREANHDELRYLFNYDCFCIGLLTGICADIGDEDLYRSVSAYALQKQYTNQQFVAMKSAEIRSINHDDLFKRCKEILLLSDMTNGGTTPCIYPMLVTAARKLNGFDFGFDVLRSLGIDMDIDEDEEGQHECIARLVLLASARDLLSSGEYIHGGDVIETDPGCAIVHAFKLSLCWLIMKDSRMGGKSRDECTNKIENMTVDQLLSFNAYEFFEESI